MKTIKTEKVSMTVGRLSGRGNKLSAPVGASDRKKAGPLWHPAVGKLISVMMEPTIREGGKRVPSLQTRSEKLRLWIQDEGVKGLGKSGKRLYSCEQRGKKKGKLVSDLV